MTKQELLQELSKETFISLQPSPVHGIGVFAIRDIPCGCCSIFSKNVGEWIKIPIADVERLPDHSRNMVETYCLYDEEYYFVPDYGFKVMDMVNYLNHSLIPNIRSVNHGEWFEAITDIPAGTELLINYGLIVDGTESYNSKGS
jgi:SET domain-containing protein